MSKGKLTSDDPAGLYQCEMSKSCVSQGMLRESVSLVKWDGKELYRMQKALFEPSPDFELTHQVHHTNFERLYTEAEVKELQEAITEQVFLTGEYTKDLDRSNKELSAMREENEKIGGTLLEVTAECDNLRSVNATIKQQLTAELETLRNNPYPMRMCKRRPDCVGLWKRGVSPFCNEVTTLDGSFSPGPWYYLGPIPVVPAPKEQEPAKMMKVKSKANGEECRAIPTLCGTVVAVINDDGTLRGNEYASNWESIDD